MLEVIQIAFAILAGGVLLTLTSETFADGVSRRVEAVLDHVEYRLALRASRRRHEPRGERLYAPTLVQEKV